jgi:RimJ/RimL family protein N-acetyltransferase
MDRGRSPKAPGHASLEPDQNDAGGHDRFGDRALMPTDDSLDDLNWLSLPDGTPVRLRGLIGTDRQALQDSYAAWSEVSRRGRFLAAPPRLTELTLDYLIDAVDQVDHVAIVLLAPAGQPDEAAVGVGRMIRYANDPATADIGLAVVDEWQGKGVGSTLARALVAHRPTGVTRLVTLVAADNRASMATLAGLGSIERVHTGSVYEVTVTLR